MLLIKLNIFSRENLIKTLQDEAREKYYAELESIAQKIRSVPLPSSSAADSTVRIHFLYLGNGREIWGKFLLEIC